MPLLLVCPRIATWPRFVSDLHMCVCRIETKSISWGKRRHEMRGEKALNTNDVTLLLLLLLLFRPQSECPVTLVSTVLEAYLIKRG